MTVDDYLDAATRRPWIYGGGPGGFRGHDCVLAVANWALALSGSDPAREIRETYSTEDEAHELLRKAGGYYRMCARQLDGDGWRRTDAPQSGDISVVEVSRLRVHQDLMGIVRGSRVIVWSERGALVLPLRSGSLLGAWQAR